MCNKKRLGQTAALLLAGMAVGLAGDAFAAGESQVPKEWNIHSNFKLGAYLEAFDSKPAWANALDAIETDAAGLPSGRANAWFIENTKVLGLRDDSVVATNKLIADDSTVVSFATDPVYFDARVKLSVLATAPVTTGAKLAIYASDTNKLNVVHDGGTVTNVLGVDITTEWHQLTVKLNTNGTFNVLLDDAAVSGAQGLTLIGGTSNKNLNQLEFLGEGKLDQLYVSHGDPAYSGTMGAIPTAITGDLDDNPAVNNWLAHLIYDGVITTGTTFPDFTKAQLDAAYLLDELKLDGGNATPVASTFRVTAIDLISPTLVKVTCKLTVDTELKQDTINGRIRLLGKATIGGSYSTMSPDAVSPKYTDFNDGLATYDFAVQSGMKFFKAQIVE